MLKHKLAFLTVPAILALGAASYGSVVAFASATPTPTPSTATEPAESTTTAEAAEPAESTTTAEAAEPNEPALPGGGHGDAANSQADTQQEGVN